MDSDDGLALLVPLCLLYVPYLSISSTCFLITLYSFLSFVKGRWSTSTGRHSAPTTQMVVCLFSCLRPFFLVSGPSLWLLVHQLLCSCILCIARASPCPHIIFPPYCSASNSGCLLSAGCSVVGISVSRQETSLYLFLYLSHLCL